MTTQQLLLIQFSEELAEVQQAVAKALRFGLDDRYSSKGTTNGEDTVVEFVKATTLFEMLHQEGIARPTPEQIKEIARKKKKRVIKWLEYSREKGVLDDAKR